MGKMKPVRLSDGTSFENAGDAEEHYRSILNGGPLKERLTGTEHQAVAVLFEDYCTATQWQKPGTPVAFLRDLNKGGTRSFYVEFDNGKREDYSFIKAVKAVANSSNQKAHSHREHAR